MQFQKGLKNSILQVKLVRIPGTYVDVECSCTVIATTTQRSALDQPQVHGTPIGTTLCNQILKNTHSKSKAISESTKFTIDKLQVSD